MAKIDIEGFRLTPEIRERIWGFLNKHRDEHPVNDTDTFSKTVHTGSVEEFQFEYTFMERLEQARDEAVWAQDFHAAADIRDLMDKFKKAGK